jgi:hypothetical protein
MTGKKSRSEMGAPVIEAFSIYDNSLVHWAVLRAAGGDPDQLKAARELIIEARDELIKTILEAKDAA